MQQASRLRESAINIIDLANQNVNSPRKVTRGAAFLVMQRSLDKTKSLPFSLREHLAMKELSEYISLAQHNKFTGLVLSNTDLLPVSHPRSTKRHAMTASALRNAKARWTVADQAFEDRETKQLIVSALTASQGSPEYVYASGRLSRIKQSLSSIKALVAALGDGNSFWARSARARKQLRDRFGRFAYQGGGMRGNLLRADGNVYSAVGRVVGILPGRQKVELEFPDGRIAVFEMSKLERVKGILPGDPDGISSTPAKISSDDPIVNESDLEFREAPLGFRLESTDENGAKLFSDDAYEVIKDADGNFEVRVQNGRTVQKRLKNWVQAQAAIKQDEPFLDRELGRIKRFSIPDRKKRESLKPVSIDDPSYFSKLEEENFSYEDLKDLIGIAGAIRFADKDGRRFELMQGEETFEPFADSGPFIDVSFDFPTEDGKNVGESVARIFPDGTLEWKPDLDPRYGSDYLDLHQPLKDLLTPEADDENLPELPPGPNLLNQDTLKDQLDRAEKLEPVESGRPLQKDFEYPEGALKIRPDVSYNPQGREEDDQPADYTDDPAELAQSFEMNDLKKALREAVLPRRAGQNALGVALLDFDDGEAYVPGEAIYQALAEGGEDAPLELAKIYDSALGENKNQKNLEDFRKNLENLEEVRPAAFEKTTDDTEESVAEQTPTDELNYEDVVKATLEGGPDAENIEYDLPDLVEGLSEQEVEEFLTGEYQKFLPENENIELPTGYYELDPSPHNPMTNEERLEEGFPKDFSDHPVDLANSYKKEDLINELTKAIEPGNNTPGYGSVAVLDEDGEELTYSVSGEALRDALQLQGEDTNELIRTIAEEGFEGQLDNIPEEESKSILEEENPAEVVEPVAAPETEQPAQEDSELSPAEQREKFKRENPLNWGPASVENLAKQDFEVDSLEEVPDGIEGPAPLPPVARRMFVKTKDLLPGDISVNDYFVIESVEGRVFEEIDGVEVPTPRLQLVGYYPGHQTQRTKQWREDTPIEVIRGANLPLKGDLPELSKPKRKNFRSTEDFKNAQTEYLAKLNAAKQRFIDPTDPNAQEGKAFRALIKASQLQPGDITADPKRGHFVVERIITDAPDIKTGKIGVEGYYPGHVSQIKQWKLDTDIDIYRGVQELPEKGELESLHRPAGQGPRGGWFPVDDPALEAEWQEKIDQAAARWSAPTGASLVDAKDIPEVLGREKDIANPLALKKPTPPRGIPTMPAFQGMFAQWGREADGDWSKFKELLKDKELIVFDYETTGLSPTDGNEPWQIAAVKVVNGEIVDRFNVYMNPGKSIGGTYAGDNALYGDNQKLTDEFLADQVSQEEAHKQFLNWAGQNPLLVSHNMAFEDEIFRRMAEKYPDIDYAPSGLMDTLSMARTILRDDPNAPDKVKADLKSVADYFDIQIDGWHKADVDSDVGAQVMLKLIDMAENINGGLRLLDVDKENKDYLEQLDAYEAKLAKYKSDLADWAALKAQQDAFEGKELDFDKLVSRATPPTFVEEEGLDAGPVGGPAPQNIDLDNDPAVIDFTANTLYPKGQMRVMPIDWITNDENTFEIPYGDVRLGQLLPGDFMPSKDRSRWGQVIAVRGGEEFGLPPGQVRVFRKNVETGKIEVYDNYQGTRLNGIRRAINPSDLDSPDTEAPVENIEQIEENKNIPIDVSVPNGNAVLFVEEVDGKFQMSAVLYDNDGKEIYSMSNSYLTREGAEAEGKALLAQASQEYARDAQVEDENTPKPINVAVSRGSIPKDQVNYVKVVEVENMPEGFTGEIEITPVKDNKKLTFDTTSIVKAFNEEVVLTDKSNHPSSVKAEEHGKTISREAAEAVLAEILDVPRDKTPEPKISTPSEIAPARGTSRAKRRRGIGAPPKTGERVDIAEGRVPQKYPRRNRGLYQDRFGRTVALGDKVIHNRLTALGEGIVKQKVAGKVGGVERIDKEGVKRVYQDFVMVEFPNGVVKKFATRMLIKQDTSETDETTPTPAPTPGTQPTPTDGPETPDVPDVADLLAEEEGLADRIQLEEDIPRGDAQAVAAEQMRDKYGISADEALMNLPRNEAIKILNESGEGAQPAAEVEDPIADVPTTEEVSPEGDIPPVPQIPKVKIIDLKEAKRKAKNLQATLEARKEDLNEEQKKALDSVVIYNLLNVSGRDGRRNEKFNSEIRWAQGLLFRSGLFDEALELEAILRREDVLALRPMDQNFKENIGNFRNEAKEKLENLKLLVYKEPTGAAGSYDRRDLLVNLTNNFQKIALNPDNYNKAYRNSFEDIKRNIQKFNNLIVRDEESLLNLGFSPSDVARIKTELKSLEDAVDSLGDLPKIPTRKISDVEVTKAMEEAVNEIKGITFKDIRSTDLSGTSPWGFAGDVSDGINQLVRLKNKDTGEIVLVKFDDDAMKHGKKWLGGAGINAEEMVSVLYRDLGFAAPTFKVVNPEEREAGLRGVGVMEFAGDGFFGLVDIRNAADRMNVLYDINEIDEKYQAELLDFVVANAIVGNTDRHRKNFMIGMDPNNKKHRLVPIDNGQAFFNGAFGRAEENSNNYLFLRPDRVLQGLAGAGNRNGAIAAARQYVQKVGNDVAKNQIVAFAERMRDRAKAIENQLRDDRASDYIEQRANWVIKNVDLILKTAIGTR